MLFYFVLKPIHKNPSKGSPFTFSTRLRNKQLDTTPTSSFVNRNVKNRNGCSSSIASHDPYDDQSSGVGSLVLSPVQSPVVSMISRFLCFFFCEK